jgi:hypothetical protein
MSEHDSIGQIQSRLLLLPAVLSLLEDWAHASVPSGKGFIAEQILITLSEQPRVFLTDYRRIVDAFGRPFVGACEDERDLVSHAASLAGGGLTRAFEELHRLRSSSLHQEQIRSVRIALGTIQKQLHQRSDGQAYLLEVVQHEDGALLDTLVHAFFACADLLVNQFSASVLPSLSPNQIAHSFLAANEVLTIVLALLPSSSIPGRLVRTLTSRVTDVFVCADAADMVFSNDSEASVAAQDVRKICFNVVCALSQAGDDGAGAIQVLRALFEAASESFADPAAHILQVFYLLDHIFQRVLPASSDLYDDTRSMWAVHVLPVVLSELS